MRVLQSFPEGRVTTNPYLLQLRLSLTPYVAVLGFSWRRALLGRYDVFHVHWPEILLQGRTPLRALARRMLFRLLLARLRFTRTALVRTIHNVRSHESGSPREERLLARFDQHTTLWIRLNPFTPVPAGALECTILHGDYRQWYSTERVGAPTQTHSPPGRVLYFGLIRAYKGVETLIDSFRELPPGFNELGRLSLGIVGAVPSAQLARRLELAAGDDPRIDLTLRHASDQELATAIHAAQVVVLPYTEMHNSGAALLALSLNRPVLVPRNVVTIALANEVGAGWVLTYDGPLSSAVLLDALMSSRRSRSVGSPNLSRRGWATGAADHVQAYTRAVQSARSR